MDDPCPTCGHVPRSGRSTTLLDDAVAFVRTHPNCAANDVEAALGHSAAVSLPTLVSGDRPRLVRVQGASGTKRRALVWRYSVVSRGSG